MNVCPSEAGSTRASSDAEALVTFGASAAVAGAGTMERVMGQTP
jgi:hypothetical protein